MRCLCWASALLILLTVDSVFAAGCSSCNGNDYTGYKTYRGSACYTPPGYCLAPGCCECPPSACDNAWDGYCEEKAKWQAYLSCAGVQRIHHCGSYGMISENVPGNYPMSGQPAIDPQPTLAKPIMPAIPNAPSPAPDKAAARSTNRWYH
jgi:hypothetical protein